MEDFLGRPSILRHPALNSDQLDLGNAPSCFGQPLSRGSIRPASRVSRFCFPSPHTSPRASHQSYQRNCTVQSREPTEDAVLPQGTRVCVFPPVDSTSHATFIVRACDCIVHHRRFPSVSRTWDPSRHASSAITPSCFVHHPRSVCRSSLPPCFVPRPHGFRSTSVRSFASSAPFWQAEFHELAEWSHGVRRARPHTSSRAHVLWSTRVACLGSRVPFRKGNPFGFEPRGVPVCPKRGKGHPTSIGIFPTSSRKGERCFRPWSGGWEREGSITWSSILPLGLAGKQASRDGWAPQGTSHAKKGSTHVPKRNETKRWWVHPRQNQGKCMTRGKVGRNTRKRARP